MKLKIILSGMAILSAAWCTSWAQDSIYFPPERIICHLNDESKLFCIDFNRRYLTEDTTNANLEQGKEEVFTFSTAAAYISNAGATVFFSYRDANNKVIKLKTINTSIQPDFKNQNWQSVADDVYVCTTSYRNCRITNLP